MAGGAPLGELVCIRELMPKSHVTAVDNDMACCESAAIAEYDEVVHTDLTYYEQGNPRPSANAAIKALDKFDVVNLDMCCGASEELKRMVRVYSERLTSRGVLMVTFSYGREVIEFFKMRPYGKSVEWLMKNGLPELLAQRVDYIGAKMALDLVSIILYRGCAMPMCSLLFHRATKCNGLSFVKLDEGDLEMAVLQPDPSRLYDCPQERIEALRRSCAAIRAGLTRQAKRIAAEEPRLLQLA